VVGSVCDDEQMDCSLEDFAAREFDKIFISWKPYQVVMISDSWCRR